MEAGGTMIWTLLLLGCNHLSGTDHDRVIYVRNDGADLMTWVKGNVDSGVFLVVTGAEALYADHYAIRSDHAVALLWCTGVISHREDWLSIAESVEFLPEE